MNRLLKRRGEAELAIKDLESLYSQTVVRSPEPNFFWTIEAKTLHYSFSYFLDICCRFQRENLRQVQQNPRGAGRRWASDDADYRRRGNVRHGLAGGSEGPHGNSDQRDRRTPSHQQSAFPGNKWPAISTGNFKIKSDFLFSLMHYNN